MRSWPCFVITMFCCLLAVAACAYVGWYTRINWNGVPQCCVHQSGGKIVGSVSVAAKCWDRIDLPKRTSECNASVVEGVAPACDSPITCRNARGTLD